MTPPIHSRDVPNVTSEKLKINRYMLVAYKNGGEHDLVDADRRLQEKMSRNLREVTTLYRERYPNKTSFTVSLAPLISGSKLRLVPAARAQLLVPLKAFPFVICAILDGYLTALHFGDTVEDAWYEYVSEMTQIMREMIRSDVIDFTDLDSDHNIQVMDMVRASEETRHLLNRTVDEPLVTLEEYAFSDAGAASQSEPSLILSL